MVALLLAPIYCAVLWCLLGLLAGLLSFEAPLQTAWILINGPVEIAQDTGRALQRPLGEEIDGRVGEFATQPPSG